MNYKRKGCEHSDCCDQAKHLQKLQICSFLFLLTSKIVNMTPRLLSTSRTIPCTQRAVSKREQTCKFKASQYNLPPSCCLHLPLEQVNGFVKEMKSGCC